ncbi:hypothetical protein BJX64DRAFT_267066 [Aspergillus heterothallicus]
MRVIVAVSFILFYFFFLMYTKNYPLCAGADPMCISQGWGKGTPGREHKKRKQAIGRPTQGDVSRSSSSTTEEKPTDQLTLGNGPQVEVCEHFSVAGGWALRVCFEASAGAIK